MLNALANAEQKEIAMYGCTVAEMRETVAESLTFRFQGPEFYVLSMMSDAQYEIHWNLKEDARQTLNRAKWILSTYCMDKKEVAA
jgi:hypothetical protein